MNILAFIKKHKLIFSICILFLAVLSVRLFAGNDIVRKITSNCSTNTLNYANKTSVFIDDYTDIKTSFNYAKDIENGHVDYFLLNALSFLFFLIGIFFISSITKHYNCAFYSILAIFIFYSTVFIWRSSFVFEGIRYFHLFDDAMISMSYAKNLAAGYGLVWTSGAIPVEGFTNFFWVIYMAVWHMFCKDFSKISLFIQLSGLVFNVLSLICLNRIARRIFKDKDVTLASMLLTALYLPLNFWALRGMEVSCLLFLLLNCILLFLEYLENKKLKTRFYVCLGLILLLRADTVVLWAIFFLLFLCLKTDKRKANIKLCIITLLLALIPLYIFRLYYYGEWLPNTAYLKLNGIPLLMRIKRGLLVYCFFLLRTSWIILLFAFGALVKQRKNIAVGILWLFFLIQSVYSIYVGGDAWEQWGSVANRYIVLAVPFVFMLAIYSAKLFAESLTTFFEKIKICRFSFMNKNCIFILLTVLFFVNSHGVTFKSTEHKDIKSIWHLSHNGIIFDWFCFTGGAVSISEEKLRVALVLQLKKYLKDDAVSAVAWAGYNSYFTNWKCIDVLGKNNSYIAKQTIELKSYKDVWPGHNKCDYKYVIDKYDPDVAIDMPFWTFPGKEYFEHDYIKYRINFIDVYFRKDSPKVNWDLLFKDFADVDV